MDGDLGSVQRPTLTFVSRWGSGLKGIRACHLILVRSSHYLASVVIALITTGCLFPEPPEWEAPKQTNPPQLMDPVPSPTKIISVVSPIGPTPGSNTLQIVVNERSEDNGEGLRAILFLNYNNNSKPNTDVLFQNIYEFPPGHLEEVKTFSVGWPILLRTDVYCIPLTLIVTHESNVDKTANHFPINNEDVASITWWVSGNNTDGAFASCPIATGATP